MKISAVWGLLALLPPAAPADPGNRSDRAGDDLDLGLDPSGPRRHQLGVTERKPAGAALNERARSLRASLSDPSARVDTLSEASGILSDAADVVDTQAGYVRAMRDSVERDDVGLLVGTLDAMAEQLDGLIEGFGGRDGGGEWGELSRRMDLEDATGDFGAVRNQIASLESIRYVPEAWIVIRV